MKRLLTYLAILLILVLASCTKHKDLLYSSDTVLRTRFDWTANPDASPASMGLAIFADGAHPVQTAFAGRDGGEVVLSALQPYQLIAFNDDDEALFTRGSSYQDFEIYAQPTTLSVMSPMFRRSSQAPRASGTENEEVVMEPGYLYVSTRDELTLPPGGITEVTMATEQVTTDYHFTIRNVENLSYAVSLVGTVSGMSGSWLPVQHVCSDTHCIIPFSLSGQGTTIEGTVRTFGHCPEHEESLHMLVIYAEMKDGSKVYFTSDITEVMHDANHLSDGSGTGDTDVPIVIESLPLPKPIINGSGLQPAVAEWTEVSITIPME